MKNCSHPGCERPHNCRGFCKSHYQQLWRTGSTTDLKPVSEIRNDGECAFEGCTRDAKCGGYCGTHYQQSWRTGELKPIRGRVVER
jgi:hypothetical protein